MREILFRGKTKYGEWVKGYLINGQYYLYEEEITAITPIDLVFYARCEISSYEEVLPETVGQFTGLTFKGVKAFEGDIVKGLFLHGKDILGVVTFQEGSFGLAWKRGDIDMFSPFPSMCNVEYEIVGNVHDNPELLKTDY